MDNVSALIDYTTDVIFVVDETGTFSYLNPAIEDVLGYKPSQLEATNGFELIHSEDRSKAYDEFDKVLEDPNYIGQIEFRAEHIDGSEVVFEVRARNRLDDPAINGVVVVGRDITERKRYERELERQNDRMEEFASVVSHDLRNPLNVAKGRLQLAMEDCESEHLGSADNAIGRCLGLINDLMTLAQHGEQVSDLDAVGLPEAVEHCWDTAMTADATLTHETNRTIRADESRLQQLLENLIRNAVEHVGNDVTITIGDLDTGFYVADDGPGIPTDQRERVFDIGYSTKDDGTGFGLNIVQEIVEAHDWEIAVTESDAGGTRFEITNVEFAHG